VMLMSYGAGGVGLNLQFANYVFLFDRWWNPAVEDQAINRAHRIGDGPLRACPKTGSARRTKFSNILAVCRSGERGASAGRSGVFRHMIGGVPSPAGHCAKMLGKLLCRPLTPAPLSVGEGSFRTGLSQPMASRTCNTRSRCVMSSTPRISGEGW
jgi:hypothetical protein